MAELPSVEPELPRAPVLAYLTQTKTAARARQVTAIATMILGLATLCFGMWILIRSAMPIYDEAMSNAARHGGGITFADVDGALRDVRRRWIWDWPYAYSSLRWMGSPEARLSYVLLSSLPGGLLLVLTPFVWRGRRMACRLSFVIVAPFLLLTLGATALISGWALVWGTGILAGGAESEALPWLLTLPVGALLAALMKDVCAYLLWFARHPMVEKPGVHFISGKVKQNAVLPS